MSSQCAKLRVIVGVALGIGLGEAFERRVGEDDAEAERVVGAVALDHGDVVRGSAFFMRMAK